MQILIAEDDTFVREILWEMIMEFRYEAIETADGAEGWDVLQRIDTPKWPSLTG